MCWRQDWSVYRAASCVAISSRYATLQGAKLAQGLCEYDAMECRAIAGRRETDQAEALGYAPRTAVVHRDQLVML